MTKFLKPKDLAEYLGVSKKTIFRYLASGQIKAIKIGQWKIEPHDFNKFLKKNLITKNRQAVKLMRPQAKTAFNLPLYLSPVAAGFPSPAEDFIEDRLDLNLYLIKNQPATFLVKVQGHSMIGAGINEGDILVVDKSLPSQDGKIVIAVLDGELTVKRLKKIKNQLYLMPENPDYQPIEIKKESELMIWGVVVGVVRKL
ncbi:MAG: translesion error-prone DNA polymerase V autoproteolytic subunit [Candidatus Buchananbacteria bacterium]